MLGEIEKRVSGSCIERWVAAMHAWSHTQHRQHQSMSTVPKLSSCCDDDNQMSRHEGHRRSYFQSMRYCSSHTQTQIMMSGQPWHSVQWFLLTLLEHVNQRERLCVFTHVNPDASRHTCGYLSFCVPNLSRLLLKAASYQANVTSTGTPQTLASAHRAVQTHPWLNVGTGDDKV